MKNLKFLIKTITLSTLLIFSSSNTLANDENYSPLDSESFFEGMSKFTTVFSQIKQLYVDDIDDETLFNNAINSLGS